MKKSVKLVICCSIISYVVFPAFLQAQQKKQPTDTLKKYTLKEVVISATKNLQDVNSVGRSVSIIGRQTMEKSVYSSVGELLSTQPGIYMTGINLNPAAPQSIFIRGNNSNQSVIMMDGIRISDPSTVDNGIDPMELSASDAARIEIVRGAHSTLYGSSAMGGVINIVTGDNISKKLLAEVNSNFGIFNKDATSWINNLRLGFHDTSGFYFNTGIYQNSISGFNATTDTITNPKTYNHPDNDNFYKLDYFGKAGFKNKNLEVYALYKRTDQKTDLDKAAYKDDDNEVLTFNRDIINYGAVYRFSPVFSINYSHGFSTSQRVDINDSSINGFKNDTALYDHQYIKTTLTGSYTINDFYCTYNVPAFRLIAGTSLSEEKMNNINYLYSYSPQFGVYESKTDLDSLQLHASIRSFYLQTELNGSLFFKKLKGLTLDAGIRYSDHNKFGNNITYEINPAFHFSKMLIFACYTTGFNAPSLYQLYSPDKDFGAITTRGNKKLQPETSSTIEAGIKIFNKDNLRITLSGFYTDVRNLIQWVYLWNKNVPIDSLGNNFMRTDKLGDTYLNLTEQKINGIELGIQAQISKVSLIANMSYITGKTLYSSKDVDTTQTRGNYVQLFESGEFLSIKENEISGLTRRPEIMAYIAVIYKPVNKLSFCFENHYIGPRKESFFNSAIRPYGALDRMTIDEYIISDLTVSYDILKNLNFSVKCGNLFNINYVEINGYASRKRGYYFKLNYLIEK